MLNIKLANEPRFFRRTHHAHQCGENTKGFHATCAPTRGITVIRLLNQLCAVE